MDKVVHFEIPFDDSNRIKAFYKTVFAWEINLVPGMDYHIVHTSEVDENKMPMEKGAINGGMMLRQEQINHPVITINVEDLKSTLIRIEAAGGKVIKERFKVGDMGWSAYFKDTEGNVMGLWQNIKK